MVPTIVFDLCSVIASGRVSLTPDVLGNTQSPELILNTLKYLMLEKVHYGTAPVPCR